MLVLRAPPPPWPGSSKVTSSPMPRTTKRGARRGVRQQPVDSLGFEAQVGKLGFYLKFALLCKDNILTEWPFEAFACICVLSFPTYLFAPSRVHET